MQMMSVYLRAALTSLHLCAPASSQPLPSASLQQLEETESSLIRRHSDQGFPPLYWAASALQPCKKHALTHLCESHHEFLLCTCVNTHKLTVTLKHLLTQSLSVSMQLCHNNTLTALYFKPSEALLAQYIE